MYLDKLVYVWRTRFGRVRTTILFWHASLGYRYPDSGVSGIVVVWAFVSCSSGYRENSSWCNSEDDIGGRSPIGESNRVFDVAPSAGGKGKINLSALVLELTGAACLIQIQTHIHTQHYLEETRLTLSRKVGLGGYDKSALVDGLFQSR